MRTLQRGASICPGPRKGSDHPLSEHVPEADLMRLRAAEEVCWTVMLMMEFDLLPIDDQRSRWLLGDPMLVWARKATECGLLEEDTTD